MFKMIDPITMHFLLIVQPLINGSYANVTDPATFFRLINASPSIGGTLGIGLLLAVFVILSIVFSYRVQMINGLLVSSMICMILSVFFNQLGVLSSGYVLLFLSMTMAFGIVSLARNLLKPFT